jgi:hypothetical protein
MERDNFSSSDLTQGAQNPSSSGSFGNAGDTSGSQGYGANTGSSTGGVGGTSGASSDQGLTDRARNIAGSAQERLADVGSTVRDRAGTLKDSLVDALESGADKLRQRGQGGGGQLAGSTGSSSLAMSDGRASQVTDRVAGGMQSTADWLRDADLDNMRLGIERQVKEHPGRTLLIAVGLGYLLGKAFRK